MGCGVGDDGDQGLTFNSSDLCITMHVNFTFKNKTNKQKIYH